MQINLAAKCIKPSLQTVAINVKLKVICWR